MCAGSGDATPGGSNTAAAAETARRHTATERFTPSWPSNYTKKLEAVTLERAHEADVTPTVFDFALWRKHRSRLRYVEHLVTLTQ